jgi:hypothetical protein
VRRRELRPHRRRNQAPRPPLGRCRTHRAANPSSTSARALPHSPAFRSQSQTTSGEPTYTLSSRADSGFPTRCTNQRPRMRLSLRKAARGFTDATKPDRKSGGSRGTCCAPFLNATAQVCHHPRPGRLKCVSTERTRISYFIRSGCVARLKPCPQNMSFSAACLARTYLRDRCPSAKFLTSFRRAWRTGSVHREPLSHSSPTASRGGLAWGPVVVLSDSSSLS